MADLSTRHAAHAHQPSASEPMSAADRAAHEAASYVRPVESRTLSSFERRDVRNTVARVRGW